MEIIQFFLNNTSIIFLIVIILNYLTICVCYASFKIKNEISSTINKEVERIKRQILNENERNGPLLKSKLLANLNKYSLNNKKDILAPISSISYDKEVLLPTTTTSAPFLNLFQVFFFFKIKIFLNLKKIYSIL